MIERLCVIGVGLIGGSLARALRAAAACREVVGAGRSVANLQTAVELGVIDRYETDLAQAVSGADMVVLCVPLGAMEGVFTAIKGRLAEQAVLTDAGSAKGSVIEAAQRVFGSVPDFFVPGHPIAGTEQSGVEASFPGLYQRRRVILTPLPNTLSSATERVRAMWEVTGAQVVNMDPVHHDEVLAATSHLPHLLAYSLVDTLSRLDENNEVFDYAAGGFRDFTRIASSDPVMWRDICLANADAILQMIEYFVDDLQALGEAIRRHDGEQLLAVFTAAKAARDCFIEKTTE
ncbi:MAG: prephenate dehydrogenase/arogenate dehydrogenase family protein [Gammaproteobacteria bacterium]|jgi:prephenate dehydrogenase|nr:prephenate dehydrogenase/arogenate dehydrogenase family protein [Gammaproteobacteria bacterium]